jgi:hypothetical protein
MRLTTNGMNAPPSRFFRQRPSPSGATGARPRRKGAGLLRGSGDIDCGSPLTVARDVATCLPTWRSTTLVVAEQGSRLEVRSAPKLGSWPPPRKIATSRSSLARPHAVRPRCRVFSDHPIAPEAPGHRGLAAEQFPTPHERLARPGVRKGVPWSVLSWRR